jgi:hypothetical protein
MVSYSIRERWSKLDRARPSLQNHRLSEGLSEPFAAPLQKPPFISAICWSAAGSPEAVIAGNPGRYCL